MFKVNDSRNYSALVVQIKELLPIKGADKIQLAVIGGYRLIVGIDVKIGDTMVYFPAETALDKEILAFNNLYRKAEYGNLDPTAKPGYFDEHGRVKVLRMRGVASEGIALPVSNFAYLGEDAVKSLIPGLEFDSFDDKPICRKYVRRRNKPLGTNAKQSKKASVANRIVRDQFRFHFDTYNLRRDMEAIKPHDYISITNKVHGTSVILANLLTYRDLKWYEKALKWLGVRIEESEFGLVWSSRMVVKGVGDQTREGVNHYYGSDVWGEIAQRFGHKVPKGYTVYGEIIGWTSSGSPIQKGYHYGHAQGCNSLEVYRVTFTNPDGEVVELTWPQLKIFCENNGFNHVEELYYGKAYEFVPNHGLGPDLSFDGFGDALLKWLEYVYVNEKMCPRNNNEVPAEGVVIRIDGLERCRSWKLKNFKFMEIERDANDRGEVDIETEQSEGEVQEGEEVVAEVSGDSKA